MNLTIIGAGLSGLSLAYFLQNSSKYDHIYLIEKEKRVGGLCRSFNINGILYDIGPHIIFSKNAEILNFMLELLEGNCGKIRRSNRIIHKDAFVQYPFENDLSKLPPSDLAYCVNTFLNNPYENYTVQNMLQFFLKTFGEGITNLYLRPYNEKIWKFDPAFMDTQMVDRIPKPPVEDILSSAKGQTVDGYTHQLYFSYPKSGGIEALIAALISKIDDKKVKLFTDEEVTALKKTDMRYNIQTLNKEFTADRVVSTIPLNILTDIYETSPEDVIQTAHSLRYNSIYLALINVKGNKCGNNFAFCIADKDIVFHRLSKIDFLGEKYGKKGTETYLVEVTYRKKDSVDLYSDEEVFGKIIKGLETINFISSYNDVNFYDIQRFEYAYVIYDLKHRKNTDIVKNYFESQGVNLCGRFGTFEYLNMDQVIVQAQQLAEKLGKR
jgi:protoporphyrinogen oxidase